MKKIFLTAVFILVALSASAQDANSIYKKYSDASDVSSVFISPAMFKLMGKLPDVQIDESEVNFSNVVKSMRGMYVVDSENASVNAGLRTDVEKLVKSGHYELLMEAKDHGEKFNIYIVPKGENVSSFVLFANEEDECTFICIDGDIPLKELQKMLD